jgi:tetratricopeptide (TPR) repeat protein
MKRTERHHLKENEFAEGLMGAKAWFDANRNLVTYGAIALVCLIAAVAGTSAYRRVAAGRATGQLAEAMSVMEAPVVAPTAPAAGKAAVQPTGTFPTDRARLEAALPKLLAVADANPTTDAGIIARYRAAAALVALGKPADGIQRYREVIGKSTGLYQAVARLGVADAQVVSGQFDLAIASYKEVVALKSEETPADAVLMHLARAYQLAGKISDAVAIWKQVTTEFPLSTYVPAAKRELEGAGALAQ